MTGCSWSDHAPSITAASTDAEFEELVSQPVRWVGVDVTVETARVVRGAAGENVSTEKGSNTAIEARNRVELEVQLRPRGENQLVFVSYGTWDLELATGSRLSLSESSGLAVVTSAGSELVLRYEADAPIDLHGAALVLNGWDRAAFEPQAVPLDRKLEAQFPRRIVGLVGQSSDAKLGATDELVRIEDAIEDVNSPATGRAHRGKRALWFRFALDPQTDASDSEIEPLLALHADGATAPVDVIRDGDPRSATAVFEIDADSERAELSLARSGSAPARFEVNLADAVLATDVP